MAFVLISHFGIVFFADGDRRAVRLETISMIASPTFMLISGMVLGYLYRTRTADFDRFRLLLADRGLFLLTVGHVLIVAACWPMFRTVRQLAITDAIGVSMLIGPALIARLTPRRRLAVGVSLCAVSWMALVFWHPVSAPARWTLEVLFGSLHPTVLLHMWPLVPWCALDLIGAAAGDALGTLWLAGDEYGMAALLVRLGAIGVGGGLLLKGSYVALAAALGHTARHAAALAALRALTSPGEKFPPSPAYFLFYAGLGCWWLRGWLAIEHRRIGITAFRYLADLGRTTVFMFVFQFFLYFTVIHLLRTRLPLPGAWPLYLGATVAMTVLLTHLWFKHGLNRFVTVGLRARLLRQPLVAVGG